MGTTLQLGVVVQSRAVRSLTLTQIEPVLPLGGLRAISGAWGACGQQAPQDGATPLVLDPGATTWVSTTFDVLVACPAPLPVLFTIHYVQEGRPAQANVQGFADLGAVPYSGCG